MKSLCIGLTVSLLLTFPCTGWAEMDEMEEMLRESAAEMRSFQQESAAEVRAFRDEADREFAEFLAANWREMREMAGLVADPIPKPKVIPKATAKPKDEVAPIGKKVVPPAPAPTPTPAPDPVLKPAPQGPPQTSPVFVPPVPTPPVIVPLPDKLPPAIPVPDPDVIRLTFYGATIEVEINETLRIHPQPPYNETTLRQAWTTLAQADHAKMLQRLQGLKSELQLNDWGYYQLVSHLSRAVVEEEEGATVLTWFVLVKSGYRCRIGYGDDELSLLAAANETIYGAPYIAIGDERYFNLTRLRTKSQGGDSLYLYEKDHPAAVKRFALQLRQAPLLPVLRMDRQLTFTYGGRSYQIPTRYNQNMTDFYAGYPLTDFPIFFAAETEAEMSVSMSEGLRPLITGKSESEAVNLLLRFVQTAFEYKTDDEQFGREKYFFAAETLAYPFCDCEDRSVLFAYLVKKLIGLQVVGLHYPGHMATAVRFSGAVVGDGILVDGERYTVCDPTYINADIGQAMPQFKEVKPKVVPVEL